MRGKALACEKKGLGLKSNESEIIFWISEWTQMLISKLFRYRNDDFQSDIFSFDIGITDVDVNVGYRRH